MFGSPDEDELDFNPSASANLASVFGLGNSNSLEKGNSSLKYTAPKQPRQEQGKTSLENTAKKITSGSSDKLALVTVKTVNSYKLVDKQYDSYGKLGAAILGNATSRIFQLLLYKGKQQQIATVQITPKFQYMVQGDLYATFYDNKNTCWSIRFENNDDAVDFARQMCVARFRAQPQEYVVLQEISLGNEPVLQENSRFKLNLSYPPQYLKLDTVQAVDIKGDLNEHLSLEDSVLPDTWTASFKNSTTGSRKILIVPNSVNFPHFKREQNAPLIIEGVVAQFDYKQTKIPLSHENDLQKSLNISSGSEHIFETSSEDTSIRARGASIKDALTSTPQSHKANLISRMARMGQATLPLRGAGAGACNPSDSEETEEDSSNARDNVKSFGRGKSGKPRSLHHAPSPPDLSSKAVQLSSNVTITPNLDVTHPTWCRPTLSHGLQDVPVVQYFSRDGQLVSAVKSQPLQLVSPMTPSPESTHISVFLSEARTHNSEIRMNMSKLSDKLENLMTKVEDLSADGHRKQLALPGVGLDPNVLLAGFEKLVKDYQFLQAEALEKNKRLDQQNERIFALLNANSKYLEQNERSEQLLEVQDQNHKLKEQISDYVSQIKTLKETIEKLGRINDEKINECASIQTKLKEMEKDKEEQEQQLRKKFEKDFDERERHLKQLLESTLSEKTKMLEKQVENLQTERDKMQKETFDLESKAKKINPDLIIDDMKMFINTVYRALNQHFTQGTLYDGAEVRKAIATVIKSEALPFVEVFEKKLNSEVIQEAISRQTNKSSAFLVREKIPLTTEPVSDAKKFAPSSVESTYELSSGTSLQDSSESKLEKALCLDRSGKPQPPPLPPPFQDGGGDSEDDWA